MQKHRAVAVSIYLVFAFVARAASADPPTAQPTKSGDGYQYNFADEPLDAAGLGPLGSRIAVIARAARQTFIRPRTAFVVEMLKSVEIL